MLPVHEPPHPVAGGARRPRPRRWSSCPATASSTRRHDDGVGLTSPEFSVLVAYAKLALKEDLLPTALPDEPWFQSTLRRLLPGADPRAVRRPARRPPAAPRDRHQRGGQLDGQPGRHHVRVPRRGGDRRHPGAGRPRVRGLPRGLRPDLATSRAVEALDNVVSTDAQTAALPGVPPAARPVGPVVPAEPPVVARRRRRGRAVPSGGRRARLADAVPAAGARSASGSSGGSPSWRRRARRARSRPGRPGCSTSTRCWTSSRSAPRPAATPARWRRSTSPPPSSSASTRC